MKASLSFSSRVSHLCQVLAVGITFNTAVGTNEAPLSIRAAHYSYDFMMGCFPYDILIGSRSFADVQVGRIGGYFCFSSTGCGCINIQDEISRPEIRIDSIVNVPKLIFGRTTTGTAVNVQNIVLLPHLKICNTTRFCSPS